MTGISLATLGKSEAKKLNGRIRTLCGRIDRDAGELIELLEQAAAGNIHAALDYPSWPAWWADNVRFDVTDRIERKSLAQIMSSKGMSQRAIGASLGVDHATVSNDLRSGGENSPPDTVPDNVIGLDGKSYKRKPPKPRQPTRDDYVAWPGEQIKILVESVDHERTKGPLSEVPQRIRRTVG
jgi:hypothetical protein